MQADRALSELQRTFGSHPQWPQYQNGRLMNQPRYSRDTIASAALASQHFFDAVGSRGVGNNQQAGELGNFFKKITAINVHIYDLNAEIPQLELLQLLTGGFLTIKIDNREFVYDMPLHLCAAGAGMGGLVSTADTTTPNEILNFEPVGAPQGYPIEVPYAPRQNISADINWAGAAAAPTNDLVAQLVLYGPEMHERASG